MNQFQRASRPWASALAATALVVGATCAHAQTVILVRHAEKAPAPADDPALTSEGQVRAMALARALGKAGLTSVITSSLRRTRDTAAPILAASHLSGKVVPIDGDVTAHVSAVAAMISAMPKEAVVLVVEHSNTVPQIAAKLGIGAAIVLPECAFDRMILIDLSKSPHTAIVARYGAPSKACAD